MTDILKQDVFFVLASALVVFTTLLVAVAGYYIFRIVKTVNYITQKAKKESDLLSEDISELRHTVKEKGVGFKQLVSFLTTAYKRRKNR